MSVVLLICWCQDQTFPDYHIPNRWALIRDDHAGPVVWNAIPYEQEWDFQNWLISQGCDNNWRKGEGDYHAETADDAFFAYNISDIIAVELSMQWRGRS